MISDLPSDFLAQWSRWYPGVPPLGYRLREVYAERWFRIHSFSELQRYPASEADYQQLLQRHNTVATDVLGESCPCAVLVTYPCDPAFDLGARSGLGAGRLPLVGAVPPEQLEPDALEDWPEGWCVYGGEVHWRPHELDPLIRSVAEDRIHALIVSLHSGRVYAPYDGGADLFLRDSPEREEFRARYAGWLSPLPSGL